MDGSAGSLRPIAELRGVTFGFPGHCGPLLRDADAQVHPGEIVLLTGPNGCGKSTVLGLLSGRLSPQSGLARVAGQDPFRADRLPAVGLITEPFHPAQSPLPVRMSLRQILRWLQLLDGVQPDAAARWREELKLGDDLLDRPLAHLSKGQRQRVMLMVVLLRRPRLILADEPLDGVDAASRAVIGTALDAYVKRHGASMLWVEHHVADAARYADRTLRVEDGAILEERTSRYRIQFRSPAGGLETLAAAHLHRLPDLIAERLSGERRTLELAIAVEGLP